MLFQKMQRKSSMSSSSCFLIVLVSVLALTIVKGEINNEQQKAEELEQILEKRFSPRQFAFAKRGIRNFAFAKRSIFDDSPFVRSFAFAKRSNAEPSMFAIIDNKRSSPSQFGSENNFARFAFAKKSLRNFAFAR